MYRVGLMVALLAPLFTPEREQDGRANRKMEGQALDVGVAAFADRHYV
jgi:hypothetical protein